MNPPVYGVYNEANEAAYPVKFDSPQLYGFAAAFGNPAASAYYTNSTNTGLKTVFSAYAEATIIPEKLKFKTAYNLDFSFADEQNYTPEHKVGGSQGTSVSSLSKTYAYGLYHILDNTLTYSLRSHRRSLLYRYAGPVYAYAVLCLAQRPQEQRP